MHIMDPLTYTHGSIPIFVRKNAPCLETDMSSNDGFGVGLNQLCVSLGAVLGKFGVNLGFVQGEFGNCLGSSCCQSGVISTSSCCDLK